MDGLHTSCKEILYPCRTLVYRLFNHHNKIDLVPYTTLIHEALRDIQLYTRDWRYEWHETTFTSVFQTTYLKEELYLLHTTRFMNIKATALYLIETA